MGARVAAAHRVRWAREAQALLNAKLEFSQCMLELRVTFAGDDQRKTLTRQRCADLKLEIIGAHGSLWQQQRVCAADDTNLLRQKTGVAPERLERPEAR